MANVNILILLYHNVCLTGNMMMLIQLTHQIVDTSWNIFHSYERDSSFPAVYIYYYSGFFLNICRYNGN